MLHFPLASLTQVGIVGLLLLNLKTMMSMNANKQEDLGKDSPSSHSSISQALFLT